MSSSPVEMASQDLFDMFFEWPSTDPQEVIVTGTFDNWNRSKYLNKTARGFVGTVKVPWGEKFKYKFIVDGKWLTLKGHPTDLDPGGFINNVYTTPPRPAVEPAVEETIAEAEAPFVEAQTAEAPSSEKPKDSQEGIAISSGSGGAAVTLTEGVNTTTSRIPIVFVPLNSTEHNTVGSTEINHPPDFVLPPSPRSSRIAAAKASTSPDPIVFHTPLSSPIETTAVTAVLSENTSEARVSEKPMKEAKEELHTELPSETLIARADVPEASEITAEDPAKEEVSKIKPSSEGPIVSDSREVPLAIEVEKDAVSASNDVLPKLEGELPSVAKSTKEEPSSIEPSPSEAPVSHKETEVAVAHGTSPKTGTADAPAALPTPPTTPSKKSFFPRATSPSPSRSSRTSPTKSGTASSRKKRTSIFGKLKHIFHHDKDKPENEGHKH